MNTSVYNIILSLIAAFGAIDLFSNAYTVSHHVQQLVSPVRLPQKAGFYDIVTLVGT
jgi:hypothetical protein